MNGSHLSVFMMSVALTYSTPARKCISRRKPINTDNSGRIVIDNKNTDNNLNSNNMNIGPNRLAKLAETTKPRKRCCPYDFDSKNCQIVNDRKVCGYNLNSGNLGDQAIAMDMGNGCWFRKGRLECGYAEGPFEGIRRPPVYDKDKAPESPNQDDDEDAPEPPDDHSNYNPAKNVLERLKLTIKPKQPKTRSLPSCVQIRRKIICGTTVL